MSAPVQPCPGLSKGAEDVPSSRCIAGHSGGINPSAHGRCMMDENDEIRNCDLSGDEMPANGVKRSTGDACSSAVNCPIVS